MKLVSFSLEQGNKYFGRIDGSKFFIGSRVSYEGNKGLMNVTGTSFQKYKREFFRDKYGFWADFIHPIATAEGALYHTLNTYDRARFTFSFLQFAAHIPNGDFVIYLRKLLTLPLAKEYFPDLILQDGRVCRLTDDGMIALESDTSTAPLLDYLNPSSKEIEDTEVIQAAKFVHWAQNDELNRQAQIEIGINHFRMKMINYAKQYNLDEADDIICLIIADIRHQGRGKSIEIKTALTQSNPINALLKIGEVRYPERIKILKREINILLQEGFLGKYKYSIEKGDFVQK